jgi:hypothetical protein
LIVCSGEQRGNPPRKKTVRTDGLLCTMKCTGSAASGSYGATRAEMAGGRGVAGGASGLYGPGGSTGLDVAAMFQPDSRASGPTASQVAYEIRQLLPSLADKHVKPLTTHVVRDDLKKLRRGDGPSQHFAVSGAWLVLPPQSFHPLPYPASSPYPATCPASSQAIHLGRSGFKGPVDRASLLSVLQGDTDFARSMRETYELQPLLSR